MAASLSSLFSLLGLLNQQDLCPITQNQGVPICDNYLNRSFDYIIVGAGTAGCTLANRLTEDSRVNVLLIEIGDYPSRESEIPLTFMTLQHTKEDWAFKIDDPKLFRGFINNQGLLPQGKALGGGSTINAMVHTEGVPYDFEMWSKLVDDSWSWESVRPYYDRVLENSKFVNYTSTRSVRAALGQAARELNHSVNNIDTPFGYRDQPITIHENTRYSKVKAYLRPIADRQNLCVVINRRVNKIIMLDESTAEGIEVQEPDGEVILTARKEIIIAAGIINSPKLLMLSGIGPSDHLTDLKVPKVYQDLPVGQNFEDHVLLFVPITFPDNFPPMDDTFQKMAYCLTGNYLGNVGMSNWIGFFNTQNETTHPNVEFIHSQIPWQGYNILDRFLNNFGFKQTYAAQLYKANAASSLFFIMPILLRPKSYGEILLRSLDPNEDPLIYPKYLQHEEEIQVLVDAIQNIVKPLLTTSPFENSKLLEFDIAECSEYPKGSELYVRCYVLTLSTTAIHPVGTCRMGKNRESSVVNTELKVWGVNNLRVIDSSVIPYVISGHPNAPTGMIAEKAADIIKRDPRYLQ